jgi:hypothetical protein
LHYVSKAWQGRFAGCGSPGRHRAWIHSPDLCKDRKVTVAVNALGRNVLTQQERECLARDRSRNDIALEDHDIDPGLTNIRENGFKGGWVRVNIIECGNAHARCLLIRERADQPPNARQQPQRDEPLAASRS